ncbi:MAG: TetR/AcrR family transcriptional regulator [Saprospiraceae bacterium]|nr:TetR/AcrR family transcriptional regulator [Candidatus Defluviibacterium haderslevense]
MDYGDRILNTASELFFKYGLKNVTMDDIAHELGMSKKTLYQEYTNKKDIVETITEKFLTNHEKEYELLVTEAKDAVEELLKLMENLNYIFERLNSRIIYDMQRHFPEAWQKFKEHKYQFMLRKIIDNLNRGVQENLYRKDIQVEIIGRMRLEQIQIALDPMIFPPEKFSIKEIHRQLLLQYLHGITTMKGHKLINKCLNVNED